MLKELSGGSHSGLKTELVTLDNADVEVPHGFDSRRKRLGVSSRKEWHAAITIQQINNENER